MSATAHCQPSAPAGALPACGPGGRWRLGLRERSRRDARRLGGGGDLLPLPPTSTHASSWKLEDAAVFLFGKTHRADFFHRILEAGLTITT
jgi:hypothetical protein